MNFEKLEIKEAEDPYGSSDRFSNLHFYDFDNDGDLDILLALVDTNTGDGYKKCLAWYENIDSKGSVWLPHNQIGYSRKFYMTPADLDNDGDFVCWS